jgi:ferredoxin-NADP reductase
MAINPVLMIRPFVVRELKWESAETYTLVLSPVDETDAIQFAPGQWVYLYLHNPDGSVWAKAAYSIASAPSDGNRLEIGIKIKGDFTKRASNLMPGDRVDLQGPFGVFVLPPGEGPMVIFAAGIGITPFRSMLRQLNADGKERKVTLFYSNRTVEDAPYLEEFLEFAKRKDWFKPVFNLTQDAPDVGTWEFGRLGPDMINRHLPEDTKDTMYLMCGPKAFMDMIKQALADKGIDVKKRLKQELFG